MNYYLDIYLSGNDYSLGQFTEHFSVKDPIPLTENNVECEGYTDAAGDSTHWSVTFSFESDKSIKELVEQYKKTIPAFIFDRLLIFAVEIGNIRIRDDNDSYDLYLDENYQFE